MHQDHGGQQDRDAPSTLAVLQWTSTVEKPPPPWRKATLARHCISHNIRWLRQTGCLSLASTLPGLMDHHTHCPAPALRRPQCFSRPEDHVACTVRDRRLHTYFSHIIFFILGNMLTWTFTPVSKSCIWVQKCSSVKKLNMLRIRWDDDDGAVLLLSVA